MFLPNYERCNVNRQGHRILRDLLYSELNVPIGSESTVKFFEQVPPAAQERFQCKILYKQAAGPVEVVSIGFGSIICLQFKNS